MANTVDEAVPNTDLSPQQVHSATAEVSITYFAYFDVGEQAGSVAGRHLATLAQTPNSSILYAYDIPSGVVYSQQAEIESTGKTLPNILQIYRDEMYKRRIAAFARTKRFGQMYQLKPLIVNGLLKGRNTQIISTSDVITCHPIISVTNLGIACIQLWVKFPGRFLVRDVIQFSDPAELFVPSVDYALELVGRRWILQRQHISMLDIMSFIAAQLLCELGALHISQDIRQSSSADWQAELRKAQRQKQTNEFLLPSLEYIEIYSLHHLDYRGNKTITANALALKQIQETQGDAIRALIKKDVNWSHKKKDVVERHLREAACTTRDSILWFVAPQGAAKLYSEDIETDFYTSMVLATFELELLLGMRYFLEKINYSLNALPLEKTKPQILARIHRQNIERLDSFFSLATCTKDTTSERLERLKVGFGVNQLSSTTSEKINALSALVSAYHNERIQHNQTILTVLFGLFGAGQLIAAYFIWYYSVMPTPSIKKVLAIVGLTLFFMSLIGIGLYMVGRQNNTLSDYRSESND